ncbi:hypothetical protein [Vibrio neptunius]|uniref:hypothetical protein n=1 Tax=Vibrio neptunius TaxID=170651 RepID=UPI003CE47791
MKLNKQERKAIETMRSVLDAIDHPEGTGHVCLTRGDLSNIERVLGINLWQATLGKKQVKRAMCGKARSVMTVGFQAGGQHAAIKHCFFPFQVKEKVRMKS